MTLWHRIIAWFRPAPDDLTTPIADNLPDRFRSVDGDMGDVE
ncbi:hypothetical protein [Pseudosulfitobacter pseudonitzschiae]|nr:hypothetical protein [Pseudosulfitobacter pseudonitzschiae]